MLSLLQFMMVKMDLSVAIQKEVAEFRSFHSTNRNNDHPDKFIAS